MPERLEEEPSVSALGQALEAAIEAASEHRAERPRDDATTRAGAASNAGLGSEKAEAARSDPGEVASAGIDEQIAGDLATAAVTGLAVAVLNAELLPGVLIGAGALLARRLLPDAGPALQPLLRTTVKAGYGVFSALQSVLAEAAEQVEDMVAEARVEQSERTRPTRPAAPK